MGDSLKSAPVVARIRALGLRILIPNFAIFLLERSLFLLVLPLTSLTVSAGHQIGSLVGGDLGDFPGHCGCSEVTVREDSVHENRFLSPYTRCWENWVLHMPESGL